MQSAKHEKSGFFTNTELSKVMEKRSLCLKLRQTKKKKKYKTGPVSVVSHLISCQELRIIWKITPQRKAPPCSNVQIIYNKEKD